MAIGFPTKPSLSIRARTPSSTGMRLSKETAKKKETKDAPFSRPPKNKAELDSWFKEEKTKKSKKGRK